MRRTVLSRRPSMLYVRAENRLPSGLGFYTKTIRPRTAAVADEIDRNPRGTVTRPADRHRLRLYTRALAVHARGRSRKRHSNRVSAV